MRVQAHNCNLVYVMLFWCAATLHRRQQVLILDLRIQPMKRVMEKSDSDLMRQQMPFKCYKAGISLECIASLLEPTRAQASVDGLSLTYLPSLLTINFFKYLGFCIEKPWLHDWWLFWYVPMFLLCVIELRSCLSWIQTFEMQARSPYLKLNC